MKRVLGWGALSLFLCATLIGVIVLNFSVIAHEFTCNGELRRASSSQPDIAYVVLENIAGGFAFGVAAMAILKLNSTSPISWSTCQGSGKSATASWRSTAFPTTIIAASSEGYRWPMAN